MIVHLKSTLKDETELYNVLYNTNGISRKKLKQCGDKLSQNYGLNPYYVIDSLKEFQSFMKTLSNMFFKRIEIDSNGDNSITLSITTYNEKY